MKEQPIEPPEFEKEEIQDDDDYADTYYKLKILGLEEE